MLENFRFKLSASAELEGFDVGRHSVEVDYPG